jgi:radical SAM protein with 4Fe4S-binding SPASM domain
VNWDGSVSPCCYDPNRVFDFGNVFREGSFRAVWNGKKYQAFRRTILENKTGIPMCRECSGKLLGLDAE